MVPGARFLTPLSAPCQVLRQVYRASGFRVFLTPEWRRGGFPFQQGLDAVDGRTAKPISGYRTFVTPEWRSCRLA